MAHVIQQWTKCRPARIATRVVAGAAFMVSTFMPAARAETPPPTPAPTPVRDALLPYLDARHVVLPSSDQLRALRERRIPGFSRQTKLACSACHYGFPQLTPFGRLFKLNGYTLSGLSTIEAGDSSRTSLKLAPFPPVSAMAVASETHVSTTVPGTQNNSAVFPDQLSVFLSRGRSRRSSARSSNSLTRPRTVPSGSTTRSSGSRTARISFRRSSCMA
jgi:hypothetical protein